MIVSPALTPPRSFAAACLAVATWVGCGAGEPWYDTVPDDDLSYLPLGDVAFETTEVSWLDGDRAIAVDAYVPQAGVAPVVLMMPGAFVVKARYRWLGATLASHGVATLIVQPRASFATSRDVMGTLAAFASQPDLAALRARLDLDRVVLAGHSAGGVAPVGLVDVAACAPGICAPGDVTPRALRGLLLLGYHNQALDSDRAPMAAADVPWLVLTGSRDGLATPDKVAATVDRIEDRPLHAIQITGANHYQLTDYVDPAVDLRLPDDLEPAIGNREARAIAAHYAVQFTRRYLGAAPGSAGVAEDLGAGADARVVADTRLPRLQLDDPGLPRVARARRLAPILDDAATAADVVASAEYRGDRYLLVRDAGVGARVLRLDAAGALTEVPAPAGAAGGFYGNQLLDGLLGAMAVFRDELYVGVSSGVQGAELRSTGAELWAWNGARWRPVVSRAVDADPAIVVGAVRGCAAGDGDPTAVLEVTGAAWTPGAWSGATVDDVGSPGADATRPLVWAVVDSTASTLVVQANDRANDATPEETVCERLAPGATLYLRAGRDESGFGEPWNKGIAAMAVFGDELFVGSALNYEDGAELYATSDGVTFETVVSRAQLGVHGNGVPITTSISALHVSSVTGAPRLFVGGTGSMDHGARLFALDSGGALAAVIDDAVDADDVGLDEAGMGSGNHQVSSMADHAGRLWVSTLNFDGSELVSTSDGVTFRREVGAGAALGPGWGDPSQLAGRLVVAGGYLWVIDVAYVQTAGELREKSGYVFRSRDGVAWQQVTAHAFGTNAVQVSQLFPQPGNGGDVSATPLVAITSGAALAQPQIFRPIRVYTISDHAEEGSR